jgi:hypothetical protein
VKRALFLLAIAAMAIVLAGGCQAVLYNRLYESEVPEGIKIQFLADRNEKGAYAYWPDAHPVGAPHVLITVGEEDRWERILKLESLQFDRSLGVVIIVVSELLLSGNPRGNFTPDDWYLFLRFDGLIKDVVVVHPDGIRYGG